MPSNMLSCAHTICVSEKVCIINAVIALHCKPLLFSIARMTCGLILFRQLVQPFGTVMSYMSLGNKKVYYPGDLLVVSLQYIAPIQRCFFAV